MIYDDTYDGHRHRYMLLRRPLQAAAPRGWIVWSGRKSDESPYGTVDYPFELSDAQCDAFELKHLGAFDERAPGTPWSWRP